MAVAVAAAAMLIVGRAPAAAQTDLQDGAPLCGTATGSGSGGAADDDGVLRVGTYNVLHTQGDVDHASLDVRVELIADELARSGVDAVGLQEVVWSTTHGLVAERLAAGLATRTGDDWAWCWYQSNPHVPGEPDLEPGGGGGPVSQLVAGLARPGEGTWGEGVAILSRHPITSSRAHRLPNRLLEAPACQLESLDDPLAGVTCALDTRTIVHARVATPCGGLDLFTTHLAHRLSSRSDRVREVQIADALSHLRRVARRDPLPDVYVGDFNTEEGSGVWRRVVAVGFVDAFRVAAPEDPGSTSNQDITDPEPTATRRIDYVFTRPGQGPLTPTDAEVLGTTPGPFRGGVVWPSDHYGVAVTVAPCVAAGSPPDGAGGSPAGAPAATGPAAPRARLPATGATSSVAPIVAAMLAAVWLAARRLTT